MRSFAKLAGFIFFIAGPLLIYFALPVAIINGMLAVLLTIFLTGFLIMTGVFLIFGLSLKSYIKSLILCGCAELLVGLIFVTSFSLEIKLLMVNVFLITMAIASRYYTKRRIIVPKLINIRNFSVIALLCVGALLIYLVISLTLPYGLFVAWLSLWPVFLLVSMGFALISKMKFVKVLKRWFVAFVVTLTPWIVIIPRDLQIVFGTIVLVSFLLLLYWGYKKYKSSRVFE